MPGFSTGRNALRWPILAITAAAVILGLTAFAAPPGGGGGGNTGGGTIYFRGNGWLQQMKSDGSGKTVLPIPTSDPSRLLHAGRRWFLGVEAVPGNYPDGGQRYEIFAYRDDGAAIQLTDDPDLEPAVGGYGFETLCWQPGDGAISQVAQEWDPVTGQVVEAGIYEAELAYDNAGNVVGLAPNTTALLLAAPDVGTHDWSPDGTRIVFDLTSTDDLWIADLLTGGVTRLYAGPVHRAVWSPDDTKIAFQEAKFLGDILTIKPDGTGLTRIIRSHGGKAISVHSPRWSPTGSHLIYQQYDHAGCLDSSDVYRVRADGSGKTNLTPENNTDHAIPVKWR